jgi:hypothetical protein
LYRPIKLRVFQSHSSFLQSTALDLFLTMES